MAGLLQLSSTWFAVAQPHLPATPPLLPHLLQLRGFLFFGVANAISVRVHEVAQCLASGQGGEACGIGGSPVAAGAWSGLGPQQAQQADRLYAGSSKHDGALFASAAAPRFLLLDLSRRAAGVGTRARLHLA